MRDVDKWLPLLLFLCLSVALSACSDNVPEAVTPQQPEGPALVTFYTDN